MGRYILRRIVGLVVVLLLVLTLVFFMLHAAPGGPETAYLGTNPTPEKRAAVLARLGLDQPLSTQYWQFITSMIRGDFGNSLSTNSPVTDMLAQRIPVTLQLGAVSFIVWTAFGLVTGALAALWRGRFIDGLVRVGSVIALSIPSFWLGLVLVLIFGLYIRGIFPSSGWVPFTEDPVGSLKAMALPAFTLGLGAAAVIARTLRSSTIEQLDSDHVAFGRAMGLGEGVLLRTLALRNSIVPTLTVAGMMFGSFMGGAVLVENVFNIPGVGQLIVSSFTTHDYPVAIAATLFTAAVFLISTLVVDLLYFAINPRIRAQFDVAMGASR